MDSVIFKGNLTVPGGSGKHLPIPLNTTRSRHFAALRNLVAIGA
jgi:hypothetical protein